MTRALITVLLALFIVLAGRADSAAHYFAGDDSLIRPAVRDGAPTCELQSPLTGRTVNTLDGHCQQQPFWDASQRNRHSFYFGSCDGSIAGCPASPALYCAGCSQPLAYRQFAWIVERAPDGSDRYRIYTARHVLDEISGLSTRTHHFRFQMSNGREIDVFFDRLSGPYNDGADLAWFDVDSSDLGQALRNAALRRLDQAPGGLPAAERTRVCAFGRSLASSSSVQYRCIDRARANLDRVDAAATAHCVPTVQGFSGGVVTVSNADGSRQLAVCIHRGGPGSSDRWSSPVGGYPSETRACTAEFYNTCMNFPAN